MRETVELLQHLGAQRFYGTVEIKYEAGQIVFIKQVQSFKPVDLKTQRGESDNGINKAY